MSSLSSSLVPKANARFQLSSGSSLRPLVQCFGNVGATKSPYCPSRMGNLRLSTSRRPLVVQARDRGRPDAASIFVGGFILGGAVVGALGLIFAPQLSEALVGDNRKEFLQKLPNFIYDEEKELEKNRKILADKIAQMNDAIDNVATQLRHDKDLGGSYASSEEYGAPL